MIVNLRRSTWVAIGLCAIAALGIAVPTALYWFKFGGSGSALADKPDEWAFIGEYIGGITGPALSLAALAALVANFILQTKQLEQARGEADRQRVAGSRQSFEATYFQLLKQFVDVARDVAATPRLDDKRFFAGMTATLRNTHMWRMARGGSYDDDVRLTPQMYGKIYIEYQAQLGPYFRNLFFLIRFIDLSDRSSEEKIRYANFVRAQLSIDEVLLLFYNGTWGEGLKFRDLIQRYGLLKHVPDDLLPNAKHLDERKWYDVSAFQSADDRKRKSLTPSEANARFRTFDDDLEVERA